MERKLYLELCQKSAAGYKESVFYSGIEYKPTSYQLSFDKNGKVIHTAVLTDRSRKMIIYCNLEDVKKTLDK